MAERIDTRATRRMVAVTALVGALALGAGSARGDRTPTRAQLNPQWSGYAVSAPSVSYSSVTATWSEPVVRCAPGSAKSLSAAWVGLGGLTTKGLEQVGVDANCDAKGHSSYFAWFELLPDIAHTVDNKVFAGDTITGSVSKLGLNLVELRIENRTRHWSFDRKITFGVPDTSSAEWIVETPFSCVRFSCRPAPLANFGSVTFHDVSAVGNGALGTLASPAWTTTPIDLVPCVRNAASSRAGATPERASSDGTTFGVSWRSGVGRRSTCNGLSTVSVVGGTPDDGNG